MIAMRGPQSEEAKNDEANGVETDPILDKIAKSRGLNLQKLLKTLKNHPDELTVKEQKDIINYSSAVLPKSLERMMIEMYRDNRAKLNELLFNHNARAATRIATVYNQKYLRTAINKRYNKEDFLSAARYGLWQGAQRFDIDRLYKGEPIKFITFATPWMFRYISEMLYEKENMIIHHSLDAKAFGDSNLTLADTLADEEVDTSMDEDSEEKDEEEEELPDLGNEDDIQQLTDDEENLDLDTLSQGTLLQSIEDDLSMITNQEASEEPDDPDAAKQKMDTCVRTLKEMAKTRPNAEAPIHVQDSVVAAVEKLCTEILKIYDSQERAITLFIGRRFIQAVCKHSAGQELPTSILNVQAILKTVPSNKKKLLASLHLTEDEFTKLCKHYTMKYINRGL